MDFLYRHRGDHFYFATQEQDPFSTAFNVAHLFNCGLDKQPSQQIVALIIAVEVEVHVLVHC